MLFDYYYTDPNYCAMNATNLTKKILDALNKNGAELGSASIPIIEKVLESEPIPATERERQIAMFYENFISVNLWLVEESFKTCWDEFLASESYRSIPTALNFKQELEKKLKGGNQ